MNAPPRMFFFSFLFLCSWGRDVSHVRGWCWRLPRAPSVSRSCKVPPHRTDASRWIGFVMQLVRRRRKALSCPSLPKHQKITTNKQFSSAIYHFHLKHFPRCFSLYAHSRGGGPRSSVRKHARTRTRILFFCAGGFSLHEPRPSLINRLQPRDSALQQVKDGRQGKGKSVRWRRGGGGGDGGGGGGGGTEWGCVGERARKERERERERERRDAHVQCVHADCSSSSPIIRATFPTLSPSVFTCAPDTPPPPPPPPPPLPPQLSPERTLQGKEPTSPSWNRNTAGTKNGGK